LDSQALEFAYRGMHTQTKQVCDNIYISYDILCWCDIYNINMIKRHLSSLMWYNVFIYILSDVILIWDWCVYLYIVWRHINMRLVCIFIYCLTSY
jgi:hypothetical protein